MRLAVEMGLPHALIEAKEMRADELAAKCGADKSLVGESHFLGDQGRSMIRECMLNSYL